MPNSLNQGEIWQRIGFCLLILGNCSGCQPVAETSSQVPSTDVAVRRTPPPDYPLPLACAGIGGQTILTVVVGAQGLPTQVRVTHSSGNAMLDLSATQRVKSWQFKPATRHGTPITQTIQVPIRFQPPQPKPEICFHLLSTP